MAGQVALRLHDAGIRVIGVDDKGEPVIPCQYEICRERALKKIIVEWKRGDIKLVKVAVGPVRSTARELRIAAALDEINIDLKFTSLDGQAPQRFVNALTRGSDFGVVIFNSAVALLAMRAPGALARLLNSSRVAFVDGPASLPFAKLTDATVVDLVAVDWHRVAKRIVDDLARPLRADDQPSTFQATAVWAGPLSQYSQRW